MTSDPKDMDKRSLAGYSPWGYKESDTTEHAHRHILRNPPRYYHLNRMARCIDTITDVTLFLCTYILLFLAETRRRQWQPTPVLLPGKSHRQRSLVGCSPWDREESDTTERIHFHALEKEMATHFSVLAWRILGTGQPGGLLSMGSHRVGHD